MSRRVAFRQADVSRMIRGALAAGLPATSFRVEAVEGKLILLPNAANESLNAADEMERRMKDAFGE